MSGAAAGAGATGGGATGEGAGAARGPRRSSRAAHVAIGVAALVLALVHQDSWLWRDRTLVFGFFPIGLLYHTAYSVVAASFWALAMRVAWPSTVVDDEAPSPVEPAPRGAAGAARGRSGGR